jgi:hypothetical protein
MLSRTANDIVAEVLMTRTDFSGAIVLVEGPSDSRFLRRHIDPVSTQITICGGKYNAVSAVVLLAATSEMGYLALVDRDFDDHLSVVRPPGVFVTDTHDIETMMLSARLDTLVEELGDSAKLERFKAANGCSLAEALLARCEWFAPIRFANEVQPGYGLDLSNLSPWKYTESGSWVLDEGSLVSDIAGLCGVAAGDLMTQLRLLPDLRSWKGARGHDAMALLSIGLKKVLGNGKQVGEQILASHLRLAFTESDFASTALYADLKAWEVSAGMTLLAS